MRGSDDFLHSRIDQMIDLKHPLAGARLAYAEMDRVSETALWER
jgi:hypothetical protein